MSAEQDDPTVAELERALVQRARTGDAPAFGKLYDLHLDRVYRYIYLRVSHAAEAEDLTEQVFLKAWESIGRYEDRGLPFAAWLFRLAHNLVVDHYRTRRPSVDLNETLDHQSDDDPAAEVETRFEAAEVRAALGALSPEHQQVLILRFIEELSHGEVAAMLAKTEGATRVLQHRALAALARVLKRQQGGSGRAARGFTG
ncbi:MAG: sigma-70 family RNA polymerase sigma factor [Chloroflexi bacterium]|nr:sigma-70 family RNA polymerase sigma factor [Chloroflexota bacterium]